VLRPKRPEPDAVTAQPPAFAEFDPILTSMRRRLIEFAATEESILAQIMLEKPNYRPLAVGQIPGPAQFAKPKPLTPTELSARELLNGFAPPLPEPPPAQKIELFSSPGNRKSIELQRKIEAVRLARETLNLEVARRTASASRLYCAEWAAEYTDRVKVVVDALVALATAFQQHEAFVNDLRLSGVQTVFLPSVGMATMQGALEAGTAVIERANEAGHVDARLEFAEAFKPLPLPDRDVPFADVKQRLAEAQTTFENVKKIATTRTIVRRKRTDDEQYAGRDGRHGRTDRRRARAVVFGHHR
jgi:hypothetical protein